MTRSNSQKRPWLGALLSFFLPGLGHVYIREWLRSAMWFAFMVSAVLLFVPLPETATTASGSMSAAFDAAMEATQGLSWQEMLPIWVVRLFSAVDAYWLALQSDPEQEEGEQCPHCGKPVDEELDFCQWCTTPLPEREGPNGPTEGNVISR
ncbi:zinc ribbon domain-containing protein [Halorussus gelatinilyticus]|uniref:Zinc ribbon domain-containing protein n=1 Tax=Halorussus gelatinilyticus TaxID=2937524 RepID=A0A8U0IDN8_9EURY|nr:zinc ribbon domain-containing protein [Halorussus gelatinilyticus]UPV99062.1 zinc ribbon domain-containing protein [Halorussus gelatinilyticus]